ETGPDTAEFLRAELQAFEKMSGTSHITQHRIKMKDDRPVKQRYFPRNPKMQEEINRQVDELLEKGCIEASNSPYSAPVIMVMKKTGKWRLCVDYRLLNERGLFQWRVMPFGLHSAPATFQRALDQVIGPEMMPHAFAYLDDIIVIGRTLEEHQENLREVFRRLRAANLRINPEKCELFKKELKYLGHMVTQEGIKTDPEKVAAIAELKPPANVKELRQYLGVASWYRRFVPDFATTVHPLTALLKKGAKWMWGQD
ncbi:hypothetical protein KR018_009974, partial [Drosophila ironensis]